MSTLQNKNTFNLLGKDYFSEKESAHYTCVSPRYFRDMAKKYGILSIKFGNKKVYRKSDLIAAIERGSINPMLPH